MLEASGHPPIVIMKALKQLGLLFIALLMCHLQLIQAPIFMGPCPGVNSNAHIRDIPMGQYFLISSTDMESDLRIDPFMIIGTYRGVYLTINRRDQTISKSMVENFECPYTEIFTFNADTRLYSYGVKYRTQITDCEGIVWSKFSFLLSSFYEGAVLWGCAEIPGTKKREEMAWLFVNHSRYNEVVAVDMFEPSVQASVNLLELTSISKDQVSFIPSKRSIQSTAQVCRQLELCKDYPKEIYNSYGIHFGTHFSVFISVLLLLVLVTSCFSVCKPKNDIRPERRVAG